MFCGQVRHPQQTQEKRLDYLLRANVNSEFGKEHHFAQIRSLDDFRKRIPIRGYDDYAEWIERAANGEKGVLTEAPIKMIELSSGSSSSNKLIPYTDDLLSEFSGATNPWLYNLYHGTPALRGTTSYWSISPAMKVKKTTAGGIPIGFEDDTEYFSPVKQWMLKQTMAVPSSVSRIPDLETWRKETLRYLLAADNLGLISVWSPSFLTLLMENLEKNLDQIMGQLPFDRARQIELALEQNNHELTGHVLWPRLCVISCWTDGWAKHFLSQLRKWFPDVHIQPKGLLATEGVVSFPLLGQEGSVLAIGSHFLEFIDLECPERQPILASELKRGGRYSPVMTTGGGLYRYHLKDVVECVGNYMSTPLIRFVGKLDTVSDICGEKLNAELVGKAVELACLNSGVTYSFALLSPKNEPIPHYCLYLDSQAGEEQIERAIASLEQRLQESHHYSYCRKLGQLGAIRVVRVESGIEKYMAEATRLGKRAGNVKPISLDVLGIAPQAFEKEINQLQTATIYKELLK